MPRIALATCAAKPVHDRDDRLLVAALRRLGAEVVDAVWDDGEVDWGAFDACLIRSTWDYAERRDELVAWADRVARATRLFNGPATVRWNTHKGYLLDLAERGIPVIDTVWLARGSRVDVPRAVRERGWARGMLKPAVGLSARETLRFACDDDGLARARDHAERLLVDEDLLLQPFLSAVETLGELSTIFVDGAATHTVRKIPVPGDYRVQDDHGAADEPFTPTEDERRFALGAIAALDEEPLYARVDWLRDTAGQPRLVELELVEPSLFFRHAPHAAERLARALLARAS